MEVIKIIATVALALILFNCGTSEGNNSTLQSNNTNNKTSGRLSKGESPVHVFIIGVNQKLLSRYNITTRNPKQILLSRGNAQ
ncbi:unnamed protein product [Allacma fusca]|uniref:Uncharacterized protein n=1 Tax=Allacma fusca TaxID=39272 RepID=A0A8J2LEQ2_9HEXA|nr:unnamed protein product [Allacma fusca]